MIQIVKFIALTIGLAFSGTSSDANLSFALDHQDNQEISVGRDTTKLEAHRVPELETHTCGYDHAIELMKKRDPDYESKMKFYSEVVLPAIQKEAKEKRKSGGFKRAEIISIPIVFHIIHKPGQSPGSGENLDDQTIIDQLETLNEDFSALNPGWDNVPPRWAGIKGNPEIKFCLAEVDPSGAVSTGITRHEYSSVTDDNIQDVIKPATGWPTLDYYNVWTLPIPGTTAAGGVAGYAYLPYPGTPGRDFDGTVLDYRFTGKGSRTLSHEIGHGFGLGHTWGSGGCSADDGIADTPLQSANTNSIQYMNCNGSSWPVGPNTCNGLEHMYINYMDYVPSACRTTFTQGQVDVMRSVALGTTTPGNGLNWASRNQLVQNAAVVAPVCNIGTPTGGGDPGGGTGPVITLDYDAGIRNILNPSGGQFCGAQSITPKVTLTNDVGDETLTTCEIKYKITGVPGSTTFNWSGSLEKNETEVVDLAPFNSPDFNFEFTAWTTNPNGEQDENGFNDEQVISLVTPDVLDPNIFEDFEGESELPTSTEIQSINPGNNFREWDVANYSAYSVGSTSAMMRNFQDPNGDGQEDILEFPILDFAEIENPRIAFDIAYYNSTSIQKKDSLLIRVSTDCGETYTTVFYEGGEDLATVTKQQAFEFFPVADEWRNEVVDLFNYSGTERMLIEFVSIGYGNNNLYIDNINLSDGCASNVQVSAGNLTCPDECNGFVNLILNGFIQAPQISWSSNVDGQTGASLEGLCAGIYSVTVNDLEFDCEFIQEIEITSPEEIKLIITGTDISFPGADNGSVNAQVFGGTDYFTYVWSNNIPANQTGDFVSGLTPGTYCVTATDQAGCEISDCYVVLGFECEMVVDVQITQPSCDGQPGTGLVTVTGANNPTVRWIQPANLGNIVINPVNNNLSPGSLIVYVNDNIEDCEETFFFEIYAAEAPNFNAVIQNEFGAGTNDGSIDLNVNGDSDYIYAWSTGTSTTEELTDIGAGSYTVTITDTNNGCEYLETFMITNLNCTLSVTADITSVSCFGETDGRISMDASGGTPPYDYMWPSGPSFAAQFNLAAGIYPVTVLDDAGCVTVFEAILEQPALLDIVLDATDESSPGAFDGTVTATVTGGTAPYEYAWSNMVTGTDMITGLTGGIYLVTVTDANDCETVKGASVEGLDCPEITLTAGQTNLSCFGTNDGEVTVVATGGTEPYNYLWTPGDYDTAVVPNLPAGEYTVVVTDAEQCPATTIVTLIEPNEFTVDLTAMDESVAGAMDGSVTSAITGGVGTLTYAWSGPPSFSANVPNISQLGPAEYCLTVTDETLCPAQACITIGGGADPCEGLNIIVEFDNVVNESTLGLNDGSLSVVVSGTTAAISSYAWVDQNQNVYTGNPIVNLAPGVYTVVVTDENGCTSSGDSQEILPGVDPCLEFAVADMTFTGIACKGDATGTATVFVFGEQETYTYLWSNGDVTETAFDLSAGVVTVTITDENGCTAEGTITITEPEIGLDLSASGLNETAAGANNGSAMANLTGGSSPYEYSWTGPSGYTSTSSIIDGLEPGTYCVTATDANDCMQETCVDVQAANDPCANTDLSVQLFGETLTCFTPSVEVYYEIDGGTAPYTVVWSIDDLSTEAIIVEEPGVISLTLIDANGCMVEGSLTIEVDQNSPSLDIATTDPSSLTANDGGAEIITSTSGDLTFEWYSAVAGSITGSQIGDGSSISDLPVGEYSVIVTSSTNGCTAIQNFELIAEGADCSTFALSLVLEEITCAGLENGIAQLDILNGTGPYEYTWMPDLGNSPAQSGLAPGAYLVTVVDANGCSDNLAFELNDPEELEIILDASSVSSPGANDGIVTVNVNGGTPDYSYTWNDGSIGPILEGLTEDIEYCVTVVDANGCSTDACVTLVLGEADCSAFDVELVTTNEITCFQAQNGAIQINIINALEPLIYEWSSGLPAEQIQTGLDIGVYSVTVTDANNCVYESSLELVQPESELTLILSSTPVLNIGAADGTATAVALGGNQEFEYTYIWSDGDAQTTAIATGLSAGEYCVTVSSASCIIVECIDVFDANDPCVEFDVDHQVEGISCFGECDGVVILDIIGGEEPYTIEWSTGDTGQSVDNLCEGLGEVTISDVNGCSRTIEFLISSSLELEVLVSSTNASEADAEDGTADAAGFGGTPPYTFEWNTGATGSSLINLAPDTYMVTVRDANNCAVTASVVIDFGDDACSDFIGEVFVQDVSCFGEEDASLSVVVDGGTGSYTYDWSVGNSLGATQGSVAAGDYAVTITDENECELIFQGVVAEPAELIITVLEANNTSGLNMFDGSLAIDILGGTSPYELEWNLNFSDSTVLEDILAGEYIVVVEDANGCTATKTIVILNGGNMEDCAGLTASFVVEPVSCFGEADGSIDVIPSGGTEPYTISSSASDMFTNLAAFDYTITVEDGAGCIFQELISVPSPNRLSLATKGFDGNCGLQGIAEVVISGGTPPFSVEWSNGDTNPIITGLETGEYTVTVTDANGCSEVSEDPASVVTEFTALEFGVTTEDDQCGNSTGSINIEVLNTDEDLLTYIWSDGITTQNRFNLAGGDYSLTIIDPLGCEYIINTEVRSPAPLVTSYSVETGSTSSIFNVTLSTVGGTGPYSYSWDDGSIGFTNQGLGFGTYDVSVTDANGCTGSVEVFINGTLSTLNGLDIISDFSLSPNPTTGEFYLDVTLSQSTTIYMTVHNILGQNISHREYTGTDIQERLNLSDQPSGTYYIRLYNEQGQMTKKLIKVD